MRLMGCLWSAAGTPYTSWLAAWGCQYRELRPWNAGADESISLKRLCVSSEEGWWECDGVDNMERDASADLHEAAAK